MLVISRKTGESIIIETEQGGQQIEIKIIQVDNQVKIGISAPKGCKIWRNELYKTIEMNRQAADSSMGSLRGLKSQIIGKDE
jgi:carbon storage regulator CsrA